MINTIENVVIVGMGALGLMFGQRMAEHLPPGSVRFLMDSKRKQRHAGDRYLINDTPVRFPVITPSDITHPADLVIFAVKATGLLEARSLAKEAVGPDTTIISLLNGISSEDVLAEEYPREQIIDCIAIGMDAVRDGSSLTYENMGRLQIGTAMPEQSGRLAALEAFLKHADVPCEICEDIHHAMWNKFMINVGVNQTCMVYRTNYGGVTSPGQAFDDMSAAMHEVIRVAGAEGVSLGEQDFEADIRILKGLNPDGYPSMRQDAMAGRPSEVELFAGTVIRLAQKHGLKVPVNQRYYEQILHYETEAAHQAMP